MTKPLLQLAALGVVGIAIWKVALPFVLPLLMLVFKIALVAGLVVLAMWWFNKQSRKDNPPTTPPPDVSA
ncbi:MAG: hypothetical protein ACREMN_10395 [Gemmatimonadales bacterium]